jgi:hypothetical protein
MTQQRARHTRADHHWSLSGLQFGQCPNCILVCNNTVIGELRAQINDADRFWIRLKGSEAMIFLAPFPKPAVLTGRTRRNQDHRARVADPSDGIGDMSPIVSASAAEKKPAVTAMVSTPNNRKWIPAQKANSTRIIRHPLIRVPIVQ